MFGHYSLKLSGHITHPSTQGASRSSDSTGFSPYQQTWKFLVKLSMCHHQPRCFLQGFLPWFSPDTQWVTTKEDDNIKSL